MKPRHSRRKKRQQERLLPEQVAMAAVREIALPDYVENLEDEFQGEWNLLCIFVHLGASATEREVAELEEVLRDCLEGALPPAGTSIDWSVGFWKTGKLLGSIESE